MRLVRCCDSDVLEHLVNLMLPGTPSDNFREVDLGLINGAWWLAKSGADVVGCCGVRPLRVYSHDPRWPETAFLSRAVVLPAGQGNGYQRRMIRCRLRWAKAKGFKRVVTYTSVYNVASSRSLAREGFVPYDPRAHWAGDGVIYWERVIE